MIAGAVHRAPLGGVHRAIPPHPAGVAGVSARVATPPPFRGFKVLEPGVRIHGRYELDRKLGVQGASSQTWLAYDEGSPSHGRLVIKMVEISPDPLSKLLQAHLRAESFLMGEVAVQAERDGTSFFAQPIAYGIDHDKGIAWFSMRIVQGRTIKEDLEFLKSSGNPNGTYSVQETASVALQIAQALKELHRVRSEKPVAHLDIKPENVMIEWKERDGARIPMVTVLDPALGASLNEGYIAEGTVAGSPGYMAPEQASGDTAKLGLRSDVYSLACVMYRMLVGRSPFRGETLIGALHAHSQYPFPLQDIESPRLHALMAGMTERNPAQRLDVDAVVSSLERFPGQQEPTRRTSYLAGVLHRLLRRA